MFVISKNGITKQIPSGFSWTTLFFWFIPALTRRDISWAMVMFVLAIFTSGLSLLIFPFIYNHLYLSKLRVEGWVERNDSRDDIDTAPAKNMRNYIIAGAVALFMIVLVIISGGEVTVVN